MKMLGLIGARGGSLRVKNKNIRDLAGHPLIAYAITAALESKVFERVIVSTDSPLIADIAKHYGAEVPFLRPAELATPTSIDVQWLRHLFDNLNEKYDAFAIVRPTSPFRGAKAIQRAFTQFEGHKGVDSIRAVELCKQHPGKMWTIENGLLNPFVDQSNMEVPWHARQYQDLPKVYIQNSSLEMAWTRVVYDHNSREGKIVAPFLTDGLEGFAIDYETDWDLAHLWAEKDPHALPDIKTPAFQIKL